METRLARISQDVKTTRSDIAEVLFYLKNQISHREREDSLNRISSQQEAAKYSQNVEGEPMSKEDEDEGRKPYSLRRIHCLFQNSVVHR